MQRIKLLGAITLALLILFDDVRAQAPQNDTPQESRGQREGGRRGGGGGRGGFGGGGFGAGGFRSMYGGGMGLLALLRVDEVRDELKIGDDQQDLIQVLSDDLDQGRPARPENFRDMTDAERETYQKEVTAWSNKQGKEAKATLATILKPEQYKRLLEISIQNQGVDALTDEEVAAKLKLSDEQKTQIAAAIKENQEKAREQMQGAFGGGQRGQGGGGGADFAALREKFETARKEADARVVAVLNAEQKTEFDAMKGAAFAMPQRGFGGGGFGGGFGGGRGPGGGEGRGDRPDRPRRPE